MVGRDDGHQPFAQDDLGVEERRVERWAGQADVELAATDSVDLCAGDPLGQQHLHVRKRTGEASQQRPQDGDRRDCGEAEPQDTGRTGVDAAGKVSRAVHQVEQPVRLVQERRPGTGQRDPAVVALKQAGADSSLQLLDLATQRRLRHREPLGCPTEVQLLRDGDETPHLIESDTHALKVSSHASSGLDEHRRWLLSVGDHTTCQGVSRCASRPPSSPASPPRASPSPRAVGYPTRPAVTTGVTTLPAPSRCSSAPTPAGPATSSAVPCQGTGRRAGGVVPGHQQVGLERRSRGGRLGQGGAGRLHHRHPERVPLRHHPPRRCRGRGHEHRRLRRHPGRLPRRLRHGRQPRQRHRERRRPQGCAEEGHLRHDRRRDRLPALLCPPRRQRRRRR